MASASNSRDQPYERRREQVRRAQRTHRERRATYVKGLEHEVAELRAQNAVHEAETVAVSSLIRQLHQLLTANGIAIPPELQSRVDVRVRMADAELHGDTEATQRLRVRLPATAPTSSSGSSATLSQASSDAATVAETSISVTAGPSDLRPELDTSLGGQTAVQPRLPTTTQLGVDFVLALEHVCLHHHDFISPELEEEGDEGATGHASMLQRPVIRYAPPAAFSPMTFGRPATTQWGVPAVELETLLSLSRRLELSDEITPVQAWQRILAHPNYNELRPGALEALCQQLVPEVRCYGFGAAIGEAVFVNASETMWSSVAMEART
ncbi:uncharacterized protein LTR77_009366 [Saxophila tyrrhenica]|uniref:BZIP domain-containing protein n=1 Tax=Saxophila tyrrhenica TaxID=1690608 RepID=A0AAV9NZL5_9PEZI|nr:hypothetical protein LTR77_009366 [Saxophila tyrrhenica]